MFLGNNFPNIDTNQPFLSWVVAPLMLSHTCDTFSYLRMETQLCRQIPWNILLGLDFWIPKCKAYLRNSAWDSLLSTIYSTKCGMYLMYHWIQYNTCIKGRGSSAQPPPFVLDISIQKKSRQNYLQLHLGKSHRHVLPPTGKARVFCPILSDTELFFFLVFFRRRGGKAATGL